MENKKNDNDYNNNNESYLDKRVKPDDLKNVGVLDGIEDKTEKKLINPPKESGKIKPIENIGDSESENNQKEMHPKIGKKKSKNLTVPLILGIIILIVIGIVAAYFLMIKINVSKKEGPQQIIKSSMQEMQKVKTYSYNGIIELDIENKETYEGFSLDVELSGKDDITDMNNIKSSSNLKLVADVDLEGGSQKFSFDLDAMQFGQEKTYLKINDFDLGMLGMMIGPEINSFKEKWYKLDLEEYLYQPYTSSGDTNDVDMPTMPTYDFNKIMKLYNKYELLEFQEDLGDTKLGNINAYHYKVKLDGIALANFYMDVVEEMMTEIEAEDKGGLFNKEEFNKTFKEIKEDIEKYDYVISKITNNVDVEIWIGKNDKLIYRTKIYGMFDKEFIRMIEDEIINRGDILEEDLADKLNSDEDGLFEFKADIRMSDFNKPVEIVEPEEAENLIKVLSGMFGGFMGTGSGGTFDRGIDTDADGLSDSLETFYGTDINNPDTDSDGYKDGEEVESGFDPLIPGNARLDYDKLFKM